MGWYQFQGCWIYLSFIYCITYLFNKFVTYTRSIYLCLESFWTYNVQHFFSFLNSFNLLYKYQFGFREKHGTNIALIVLVDEILQTLDEGKIVLGVFLDLILLTISFYFKKYLNMVLEVPLSYGWQIT